MYTTNRARRTQQILLRKRKLPGTNFPAEHDRRHISTFGTEKNDASSLRYDTQWEIASIAADTQHVRSAISISISITVFRRTGSGNMASVVVGWKVCPRQFVFP